MDDIERSIRGNVAEFGWHRQIVGTDDGKPWWGYSIGLFQTHRHPEVVVFGLPPETLSAVLETIWDEVVSGRSFADGQHTDAVLHNYDVAFRAVHPSWYRDYFGRAIDFYRGVDFPMIHCFWPDREGRFPWDPDAPDALKSAQPNLTGQRGVE